MILSIIKKFWKPKVDFNHTCLAVTSLDSALKKDENYYLQAFSKWCKYIKKKVVRPTIDDLESSSDDFDSESSFEWIKITKLNILIKELWKCNFRKCIFWGSNFENVFLLGTIFFFFGDSNFENVSF